MLSGLLLLWLLILTLKGFYLGAVLKLILLLLTAIGLSPGGSSPILVQTKIKIHKTTITTKQQVYVTSLKFKVQSAYFSIFVIGTMKMKINTLAQSQVLP
jgi:hypothetical protein